MSSIPNLINNGKSKPYLSKFLTLEEQKQLSQQNVVNVVFQNIYDEEIRKRAIICPKNYQLEDLDFKIKIYRITYDKHFGTITHPQILGTIMSLGVTREMIGDIVFGDEIYLIVGEEISQYIITNLILINNISVHLTEVDAIANYDSNYISEKILVASLRLDAIVSKVTNLSREKAKSYIISKMVRVNGNVNTNNDYVCKFEDVLSITKYGRIIIKEIIGTSKKDKIILRIERTK